MPESLSPSPHHREASSLEMPVAFDVLVVGSGAAGLYAALRLPLHLRVGIVTKSEIKVSNSDWAQGGIAAAIDPGDSPHLHFEDTLRAGAGLCEEEAVRFMVENAATSINSLLEFGVTFDSHGENLAMTLEAAHSRPRVLHSADRTGQAIVRSLAAQVLARENICVWEHAFALKLWHDRAENRCRGLCLLWRDRIIWLKASAVILATGGGGRVFAKTTNPPVSTGDGVALAWRCGAVLRDLEFVQFHPTALSQPKAPHFLISEAVRGEGAHLLDESGYRFAFDYHPKGELAPRDVVSRAIFHHLQKTAENPAEARVYLDASPIDRDRLQYRFPNIIQKCKYWGIDAFKQPIPVSPAAHYWMGGVAVSLDNATSIPGLYAIGEVASTGVQGANRLASNSLLECVVFAAQFAQLDLDPIENCKALEGEIRSGDWPEQMQTIAEIQGQLPIVMWQGAGICRSREQLLIALDRVESWRSQLENLDIGTYLLQLSPAQNIQLESALAGEQLKHCTETLNLLDIAALILKSAVFREESRGGHYRTDYSETLPDWQLHTLIQGDRLWTDSVGNNKRAKERS